MCIRDSLQTFGNVYSRLSNPTVAALEERVAALEQGRAAVASASGMAAEAMALMTLLQQGDHVVAAGALYGGTVTMLAVSLAKFGITTTFVDATRPEAFAAAMQPNTRAVFAESLGNPSLAVLDIAAVADVAHAHGVPLVIDNTVPSPFLCNPIALGADIVVHSATKFIGGHGTSIGGSITDGNDGVSVSCTVRAQGAGFNISGSISKGNNAFGVSGYVETGKSTEGESTLNIDPNLLGGNTKCTLAVDRTIEGSQLAIGPGRVWARLSCTRLEAIGVTPPRVCKAEGYIVFENCTE